MSIMAVFIKVILFIYVLYTMLTTVQSAEKVTWFEAQRCCASRSGQLDTIDDKLVSCNNIPSGAETLWTGNVRRPSEWIEFQGCYEINGFLYYHNNISECYHMCLHKQQKSFEYFSYKEKQCLCQIVNPVRKADSNKTLCRTTAQTNYSWLYKVLYNTSFDGYGNCVASKCTNGSQTKVAERCRSLKRPMCGLPSDNEAFISSTTNWNKSRSNCKDPLSTVNNAIDICELNENTTKTGMWTNIFRVEISSRVDHGDMIKMTDVSSCVIAQCLNNRQTSTNRHINCNDTADGFFCKSDDNSTMISSADCIRQTTKVHNISEPHSTGQSTVPSSISKYPFSSSHHSTKTWKTDNKEISKVSVSITVSASVTKLNGNFVSKQTTYSTSSLGTATTSDKLPDLICGVTVGGVVLIAVIVIITCKMRNVGPFRKGLYKEDNIEMNNSIDCAVPVYQDTALNTDNGGLPKNAIRNNTAENTSTGGEKQNNRYFSNYEYAVVVKKHPAGPAAQPSEFDLEEDDNQSQRFETEDEYDALKHTFDKGEEQIENNVYDSSLGICDGVDPTYNSIKIGPVNNDTTYDHTANIV